MRKAESIKNPKIREKYAGQYIARDKDNVLLHEKRSDRLFKKMNQSGIDPSTVVIDYIPPKDKLFSLHAAS